MEVAGLAISIVGLAALCDTCITGFQRIQRGRSFGHEYTILTTKLGNQEYRFKAWARASGLAGSTESCQALQDHELRQQLGKTLNCVQSVIEAAEKLENDYDVRNNSNTSQHNDDTERASRQEGTSRLDAGNALDQKKSRSLSRLFSTRLLSKREKPSLLSKTHWVIEDRDKFAAHVTHLKDFIDDLESLTKDTDVAQKQRFYVDCEIQAIDNVQELQEIETARDGEDDMVSNAASVRMERLSHRTASATSGTDFVTARSHIASIDSALEASSSQRSPRSRSVFRRCNCILVGEPSTRKASIIESYTTNRSHLEEPEDSIGEYTCIGTIMIDSWVVTLAFCNVDGKEDWDIALEREAFAIADVVMLCVAIGSSEDYHLAKSKWAPQLDILCPEAKRLLVGVGASDDLSVDYQFLKKLAKDIGAEEYVSCDWVTQRGLKYAFYEAARVVLADQKPLSWTQRILRTS